MSGSERPTALLGAIDAVAWVTLSAAVGAVAARIPDRHLDRDTVVTRLRPAEHGGRLWERVGVRRWKDRLPDAGGLFGGGPSKSRLGPARQWERLALETRRAELVHWVLLGLTPLLALRRPRPLALVIVVGAVAANAPCIITQRYNRGRVLRLSGGGR